MSFEYDAYLSVCFIIPTIVILTFVLLMISCTVTLIKNSKDSSKRRESITGFVFMLVIFGIIVVSQINYLSSGGIYLATEKESDAVTQTITIENVCEPSERFPNFKYNHKFGADITSGNGEYFAISCSKFSVGDIVNITYLPRSGFVLKIDNVS